MRKEMYIIRGSKNEDYKHFTDRMVRAARSTVELIQPEALKITLTCEPPPKISVIPYRRSKIAIISVYRRDNNPIETLLNMKGLDGAYKVDEALPIEYERNWADGLPTPGACLLTLFHRKPGIDYQTFLNRWHNGHSPLSLKIHPLCNYNRNVVVQKISEKGEWWDGIVEEQTMTRSELLNPFKFFGNGPKALVNMLAVYKDTKSFINYKTIETYFATEYHILSHSVYVPELTSQTV